MDTKILTSENKLYIVGHSENNLECMLVTAICDDLVIDRNFEMKKYEQGYAEFIRVSGGENQVFDVVYDSEMSVVIEDDIIIFEGHANSIESCKTWSALFDCLVKSENFRTLTYSNGVTKFERLSGGEIIMFSALEAQVQALSEAIKQIKSCTCVPSNYGSADDVRRLQRDVEALEKNLHQNLSKVYQLPYTASELLNKLSKI
jgi:hypothetical protein